MKRSFLISVLLIVLLTTVCLSANAEVNVPSKQILTNKALKAAINGTKYATWTLYAPADSEISGKNIYSTAFFKHCTTFPIVAVKDDQSALIVLTRKKLKWILSSANEKALTREGLVIDGFWIDTSAYDEDDTNVLATINFSSKSQSPELQYRYDLAMWINGKDEMISLSVTLPTVEELNGREYYDYSIVVNQPTLFYRFLDAETYSWFDYDVGPNDMDHSLSGFDLSALSLWSTDLMK